jgi:biotin carboxyl carrier protein
MNTYVVTSGGSVFKVAIRSDGAVEVDGNPVSVDIEELGERTFSILVVGKSYRMVIAESGDGYDVLNAGILLRVDVATERDLLLRQYSAATTSGRHRFEVRAPMPAMVTRIEVNVGDDVVDGQGLIILDAMKMENEIRSQQAGRVKEVCVTQGKAVEKGQLLLLLE